MLSNYTISLEEIINQIWIEGHPEETQSAFSLNSYQNALSKIDEKIEYALPFIFSYDFVCYGDEEEKKELEKHILTDYYTRNICCDSFARWLLFLKGRLEDIMPRYKALYEAQAKLIAMNVLEPYRIEEERKNKVDNKKNRSNSQNSVSSQNTENTSVSNTTRHNEGTDTTDTSNENRFSNMPQAMLQAENDYLTNLTRDKNNEQNNFSNDSTTNDNDTSNSLSSGTSNVNFEELQNQLKNEEYSKIIKGNIGKQSNGKLIKEYQDVILNIEKMIVDDLKDLFYLIY